MFAIYSAALMFLGTGNLLGLAIFPIVQVDQFHLSYASVGLLSLANSLTWMVSSVALGALLDRKGALPVMLVANIAQALMPICYFMASDVTLVAVAFVLGGVAMAGGDLAWLNVVLLFSGPDRVPDYSALHMLLLGVRGVIGPILGAILLNVVGLGLHETLLVAFAVQIAGSLIMMWVTATYRSPQLGVSTVG
jgi:hypothetical protein